MHSLYCVSVLTVSILFSVVHATPAIEQDWDGKDDQYLRGSCLSDHDADWLVSQFESLYSHIDINLAKSILTPDFHELSFSTNRPECGQIPPTDLVSASRKQFIQQQVAQQGSGGSPEFITLNVWHSCDTITFRWKLPVTDPSAGTSYLFTGIDLLEIEPGSCKIKADYSEYSI